MIEIRLPKPGPEIEEATITSWECTEGDKIKIGDILAIIKTPVGSFKVAAEEQGILETVLQKEGDAIDFDEPIAMLKPELAISDFKEDQDDEEDTLIFPEDSIDESEPEATLDESEPVIDLPEEPEPTEESPTEEEDEESIIEEASAESDSFQDEEPEPEFPEPETVSEEESQPEPEDDVIKFDEFEDSDETEEEVGISAEKIPEFEDFEEEPSEEEPAEPESSIIPDGLEFEISPAAMKLAEQAGIDLTTVEGSGEDGKIHYIDVENAIWERAKTNQSRKEEAQDELEQEEASLEEPVEPELSDIAPDPEEDSWSVETESVEEMEQEEALQDSDTPQPSEEPDLTEREEESDIADEIPEEAVPSAETVEEEQKTPDPYLYEAENLLTRGKLSPDYNEISIQYNMERKDDLIIPFNTVKKTYSDLLTKSHQEVPQIVLFEEIDFTNAERWREVHNTENKIDIQVTDLVVKACGHALALMPEFNAYVRSDRIILKRSINIAVATATDEGVVAPVVPDVYHKPLQKVSETIRKNTSLATESKVVLDYDTAFTVMDLGGYGVKRFIPVVTSPQSGCLAVGEIAKKVVPINDFAGVRKIMEVALACDHRSIDGPAAARFLQIIHNDLESLIPGDDPDWVKGNEQLRLI